MINQMNDLAVQSHAGSSISSYVHVPTHSSEWSVDETTASGLTAESQQVKEDWIKMKEDRWCPITNGHNKKKLAHKMKEDMETKKRKLETSTTLSMIDEVGQAFDEGTALMGLRKVSRHTWKQRRFGPHEYIANKLVTILRETEVPSLKLVNLADLRSDLEDYFFQETNNTNGRKANNGRTRFCSCFIGFKIAHQNQLEKIQSDGFHCGPGFHLCKTIENAKSFRQFERSTSSDQPEHLWIVLGTEPPQSDNRNAAAEYSESYALPLACIDVRYVGKKSSHALNTLVFNLKEWAKDVS